MPRSFVFFETFSHMKNSDHEYSRILNAMENPAAKDLVCEWAFDDTISLCKVLIMIVLLPPNFPSDSNVDVDQGRPVILICWQSNLKNINYCVYSKHMHKSFWKVNFWHIVYQLQLFNAWSHLGANIAHNSKYKHANFWQGKLLMYCLPAPTIQCMVTFGSQPQICHLWQRQLE